MPLTHPGPRDWLARLPTLKTAYTRTAALLLAFVFGALIPQAHVANFMIRWMVMTMLYLVFLNTPLSGLSLRRSQFLLFAANIAMGFAGWCVGFAVGGRELALALFFAGIAPTATAAPVVISFLRGRVDYVVTVFLLTNLLVAMAMPFMLPIVLGHATGPVFLHILGSVVIVVFAPTALAWLTRTAHPDAVSWPPKLRNFSFAIWVGTLFLVTSNASFFLRNQSVIPVATIATIGALSALLCAGNFAIGRFVGRPDFRREASQALGQKNTTFTIYLALTYANPLVALGPTFYVLWHNIWNSWQLHRAAVKDRNA